MRRAKIVATLGPATSTAAAIEGLVAAGMDVARLNLSHGDYADHESVYALVRAASDAAGRGVGILVDLQGPKIRLGRFASGPVLLESGDVFIVTTDDVPGDREKVSTTYAGLPGDVSVGDVVLVDDGRIELRVTKVEGNDVHTVVVEGGRVSDNKGFNLPGVAVSVPALSDKDKADLRWALRTGADMIALSFVRSAADIVDVHAIMDEEGIRLPVLAKVEKPQAIENLEEIIAAFDGVMVARGDLGVELPLEAVPLVQKRAIQLCREASKPVIVATQMLDSMAVANRPTRAEASDVANAVLDGADALMLSGETSVGHHPNLVVETMARIIEHVETWALHELPNLSDPWTGSTARALTHAAVGVAEGVDATHLIAFTETGSSARLIARWRSRTPILAFTPNPRTRSMLSLVWGVETFLVAQVKHTDDMVRQVDKALLDIGRATIGDRVVIVAGVPPGVPGTTNGMRVHKMGSAGPASGV
ncbi:MAG: pyruvate kinase [Candidatus Nanopelagicales bacterium]|nr:pyruvate kinase [Candidatus Nanopelagicales bacterium]MCF8536352.1 pyruvate kinase [Candidatus Nanopelagicales bacterium]MCF8541507.1 pyruvate kinase [Candidatus Nanopelagicales bacterium]MCF8556333.1 pyruvate kinase [Candidatus Nanopelagicales bacterium]